VPDVAGQLAAVERYLWDGTGPGDLAFDVGTNTGGYLPQLAASFSRVVAFEPATESFTTAAAAWDGDSRVTVLQVAISAHTGTVTLDVCPAPIQSGQLTTPGMSPELGWGAPIAQRVLGCITLDEAVNRYGVPDFVKVDTEGHEAQVLQGATRLLAGHQPQWLVEFHSGDLRAECTAILEAAGYTVETVSSPQFPADSYIGRNYGWLKTWPASMHP